MSKDLIPGTRIKERPKATQLSRNVLTVSIIHLLPWAYAKKANNSPQNLRLHEYSHEVEKVQTFDHYFK